MKKSSKVVLGGILAVILLLNTVGVAALKYEYVTATIDYELDMKLNGVAFEPREADGSALRPLLYKGRTYLPVAALGKALDIAVSWDENTRTVNIGESSSKIKLEVGDKKVGGNFSYTVDKDLLYIAGNKFNYGLVGVCDERYVFTGNEKIVNNNHQKLGFSLVSDLKFPIQIKDADTGMLIKEVIASPNIQNIELDVAGVKTISIVFRYSGEMSTGDKVVIGEPYWK